VHNFSTQTTCMLCPSLAAVCAVVVTCRPCVWPEQALVRPCDTWAACHLLKSYPDDDLAESKHAAVGMFCKTIVFDHYLFIYLFLCLQSKHKTGCITLKRAVCLRAVCCGPAGLPS
jgi:hypothetical protein